VRALGLWQALNSARSRLAEGEISSSKLEEAMRQELAKSVDVVDYAAIVHPDTMEPLIQVDETAVAILAARVGNTRLIDNLTLIANEKTY